MEVKSLRYLLTGWASGDVLLVKAATMHTTRPNTSKKRFMKNMLRLPTFNEFVVLLDTKAIRVSIEVDQEMAKATGAGKVLVKVCPAHVYSEGPDGTISVEFSVRPLLHFHLYLRLSFPLPLSLFLVLCDLDGLFGGVEAVGGSGGGDPAVDAVGVAGYAGDFSSGV